MTKRYSSPKLPQDLKLDIDDEVALTVGERAADRIARGAHLTEQLEIGRALVVLSRVARASGGRGGDNYPVAMSAELEDYPRPGRKISPQLRAAAIWCIVNWNDGVKAYLDGDITDHQRQTMGVRGVPGRRHRGWRGRTGGERLNEGRRETRTTMATALGEQWRSTASPSIVRLRRSSSPTRPSFLAGRKAFSAGRSSARLVWTPTPRPTPYPMGQMMIQEGRSDEPSVNRRP